MELHGGDGGITQRTWASSKGLWPACGFWIMRGVRYWLAAVLIVGPIGLLSLALGAYGVVISPTSQGVGALLVALGVVALAPIASARRTERRLRPLETCVSAGALVGLAVVALVAGLVADGGDVALAIAPGILLLAAAMPPLLLRMQQRRALRRSGRWCWTTAAILLAPIGVVAVGVGCHDLLLGVGWGSRIVGLLATLVGTAALVPIFLGFSSNARLATVPTLLASLMTGAAAIAIVVALNASHRLQSWRLLVPIVLLTTALLLPVLLRLQRREPLMRIAARALRAPAGKVLAVSAVLVALLQVGVSLRTSTRPEPLRVLMDATATRAPREVTLSVTARNRTQADLPLLADIVNVIAARCPDPPTGEPLVQRRRTQRVFTASASDVSFAVHQLETDRCRRITLLDTGAIAGEGGFLPGDWKGDFGSATNCRKRRT